MEIPLYILLIAYFVGVGIFLLWTFFNVYHLVKFGLFDFTGKLNAFIFVGFVGIIFVLTALMLRGTPWTDTIDFANLFSIDQLLNSADEFDI